MNRQEIVKVLEELHKISKFRVSLHGADFAEIAAYPEDRGAFCRLVNRIPEEHRQCLECDKEACHKALGLLDTYIYKCRFGLIEAVSPLYNFGTLTGFLMMGQVAETEEELILAERMLRSVIGIPDPSLVLKEIPTVSADMLNSYVKIMTICAQYLTLSNAVVNERRTVAEEAADYIGNNLDKKLGIGELCSVIGCSKSTLINGFKKRYGTTVNSFTTEMRLKRAEAMLLDGKRSVAEISAECGFSDQSYFSKVFSAKYGTPPSEFRAKR